MERGLRELSEAEPESGDLCVPVVLEGLGPAQFAVASEERRPEHAFAGLQADAQGLGAGDGGGGVKRQRCQNLQMRRGGRRIGSGGSEPGQLLLAADERGLEQGGARVQVLARERRRGGACGRDGRNRGGGQQGGRLGVREGQEAEQLSSAGTELGPERVGAGLQVDALSLLAGGVSGGGRRPLKESLGGRRQVGFHAELEARVQPSAVSFGDRVAQEVGVVPSRASAFRSSETLGLGSCFVSKSLAELFVCSGDTSEAGGASSAPLLGAGRLAEARRSAVTGSASVPTAVHAGEEAVKRAELEKRGRAAAG
jgi:hypothetical protein